MINSSRKSKLRWYFLPTRAMPRVSQAHFLPVCSEGHILQSIIFSPESCNNCARLWSIVSFVVAGAICKAGERKEENPITFKNKTNNLERTAIHSPNSLMVEINSSEQWLVHYTAGLRERAVLQRAKISYHPHRIKSQPVFWTQVGQKINPI